MSREKIRWLMKVCFGLIFMFIIALAPIVGRANLNTTEGAFAIGLSSGIAASGMILLVDGIIELLWWKSHG